ncbi:MAG: proton-conducting transporter membrane subunit [Anaerolineales bacterium]
MLISLLLPFLAAGIALLYGQIPAIQRRISLTALAWMLAAAPAAAFILLASLFPQAQTAPITLAFEWLPSLGVSLGLYYDALSGLFSLMVTGIGALVIVYAGYYFAGDTSAWRFLIYLLLFMGAMLGLILAGDVLTLFVFWEGTSIISFLLVAYKYQYESARAGAFKALFITGGGGIVLLAGLLFLSSTAGATDWQTILRSGDFLRAHPYYPAILLLIAFGAFTKSAQFPAHIWLPDAMSAPTPASAYLHSATMVKAGIYLMARLNPALGNTELWFWLLSSVGLTTMLVGAYLGFKQNDLKALLAYSTISQLGVLMALIGQDTEIAFKALVIGILAHALYKSALFMAAGIIDHETGTRDLRQLGGLRKTMPRTFFITVIAALSMAGLPPLFGFLAKETLLATAIHPSLPAQLDFLFPMATVAAGAFLFAQAALLLWETFAGAAGNAATQGHDPAFGMWLPPLVPAFISLGLGLLPEPQWLASGLASAAAASFGAKVKVSLALWTGINAPLMLSVVAVSIGTLLFAFRSGVRQWQTEFFADLTWNTVYSRTVQRIEDTARAATQLQQGRLRLYLATMLTSLLLLTLLFGDIPLPNLRAVPANWSIFDVLRLFALLLTVAASLASVALRRDLFAILALGASGLSMALLFALEPAPDVALVQVVVDILTTVILILALTRLPRAQREQAWEFTFLQSRASLLRDGLIALGVGALVTLLTLNALSSRPRPSQVTPFYEANAKTLTGAKDIVGAIVVDFRALDTLIEITVFAMAGLGIYALLRHAAVKAGDGGGLREVVHQSARRVRRTLGIGGAHTSPFIHALAYLSLPLSIVIAATHAMYGHDQPGDGFTAGVILSLAIAFWYLVFGYTKTRSNLPWLRPNRLIAAGLLLALAAATSGLWLGAGFFAPVNFGARLGLPLPYGFGLTTAFLFEVAIALTVLGSAAAMLNTLSHPSERD